MSIEFIIPTAISGLAIIWNYFQQKRIESIRTDLQKTITIHKYQFEKEFQIYEKLWEKLISLRDSTYNLRPFFEQLDPNESDEERKNRKLTTVYKSFIETVILFNNNRPFYSPKVYDTIDSIFKKAREEMIEYEYQMPNRGFTPQEIEKRDERIKSIIEHMDIICSSIRERIHYK